ncbi:MAG: hypothetical protein IKE27_06990 [Oscillospiraceae bacterium]|nr:hypothetical protein [Oscillospiraceae bacterium]
MACFLVPATEAVITTIVSKSVEKKKADGSAEYEEYVSKHPFLHRLNWLNKLLWGGSALLAFEHIWHGEVVPWFPFLTAAANPADTVEMLHEMMTVGVSMAVIVTVVWLGMVMVTEAIKNRGKAKEETV